MSIILPLFSQEVQVRQLLFCWGPPPAATPFHVEKETLAGVLAVELGTGPLFWLQLCGGGNGLALSQGHFFPPKGGFVSLPGVPEMLFLRFLIFGVGGDVCTAGL